MKHSISSAIFLGAITVPLSQAQFEVLPFPLTASGQTGAMGSVAMNSQAEIIHALTELETVLLTDVALPSGALVDLRLERLSVARRRFGFQVDGQARADLLDALDLSVWKGEIEGEPGSVVMLGFSDYGSRGWIQRAGELVHFMPQPDASGDWRNAVVLVQTEAEMNSLGFVLEDTCAAGAPGLESLPPTQPGSGSGTTYGAGNCGLRECPIAFETDWQLFQVFGDLNAMTAYVTTLLTFVSDRYETQVSTVLTFPYMQFYTNSNDPWSAQDSGGNCQDVLYEFRDAWAGNVPANANLGHLMSGASLGCGVAWLDVLCSTTNNFSVSGNINGDVNFPVVQQPNNWDFIVVAHELGHNFASPHTHDYCPPLDECPAMQYWGQCQDEQICLTNGTIMSYCHLCPGGTGNITTFFHPTAATVMTNAAAACLPLFVEISGESPSLLDPQVDTPVAVDIIGTPVGPVELHYRYDLGAFAGLAMTDAGNGHWTAELPAPDCGQTAEFYYSFTEATCGTQTDPSGAPTSVYSAQVGSVMLTFGDDFEADNGWSPTNLGATTGDWQRGVPVDDASWDYDPHSDSDGSGSAYLTQNELGNTDVDGGTVQLESPTLDMSAGDVLVSYDYFLRLTNSDGSDMLLVEASQNAGAGPWIEVARHDTDGGLIWRHHEISSADLIAAGLTPNATMRLRFSANDSGTQSIVEAGLDAFAISTVSCDDGGIGTNYCLAGPTGAAISASGSTSVSANDFHLTTTNVPLNQNGMHFYGNGTASIPLGLGTRCVGGSAGLGRLGVINSGAAGELNTQVDFTHPPTAALTISAGSTWYFQAWFRLPGNHDLSDGLEVSFVP